MREGLDADGFQELGPHRYRVELPDIVHVRLGGAIEAAHVAVVLDAASLMATTRVYILRDARGGGSPSRSARERIMRHPQVEKVAAVVTYGAGYRDRVVLGMVDKALRVLRPNSPRVVVFETEAEARGFIEGERERMRGR
jgi:hypothetical protein